MTLAAVVNPYQPLVGLAGIGLSGGALYIGVDGLDPQSNPQACYWDAAGTIPATQPIPVTGGYPMRLGSPAQVFTTSTYSMRLRDASGVQVFYLASAGPNGAAQLGAFDTFVQAQAATILPALNYITVSGRATVGDGGQATYKRTTSSNLPGYWQSADGAWWVYVPDARGVNAKAGPFGAVDDGTIHPPTGTNNAPKIQAAIDFATYQVQRPVYLTPGGTGVFMIADTLQIGYGTGFTSTILDCGGPKYNGESSFQGAVIAPNFGDRPCINVQGGRNVILRGVTIVGLLANYIGNNNFGSVTMPVISGSVVDDTIRANWVDPAVKASYPNLDSRYAPYAGVSIDAYAGPQPATHYPAVTYPAWLGAVGQYSKAFTSGVQFEDCYIAGFYIGVAIQPCDADGNGDFINLSNCLMANNVVCIAAGNSQSRNFGMINCNTFNFHTFLAGSIVGRLQGSLGGGIYNTHFSTNIMLCDYPNSATPDGVLNFDGCYGENMWSLGIIGTSGSGTSPIKFKACKLDFANSPQGVTGARGFPTLVLNNPASLVSFDGCFLNTPPPAMTFGGAITVVNTKIVRTALYTNLYQQFAENFLMGGFMIPVSTTSKLFPSEFSPIPWDYYDLSTGGSGAVALGQVQLSRRGHPVNAWVKEVVPEYEQAGVSYAAPKRWAPFDWSALISFSLVGSTLTLNFAALTTATAMLQGPLPGDVMWDQTTHMVFFVRSRIGTQVLAELQSGYRYDGVSYYYYPTLSATPPVFSGLCYVGNARVFTPGYFTQGDLTAGNATVANVGRADGYGGYMGGEFALGDALYLNSNIDNTFTASDIVLGVLTPGTPGSFALSGNALYSQTKKPLPFFIQKPPPNL